MKIAVMGTGGVGGYYGGKLAAAGEDVTLIARGPHLAAIRRDGLKLTGPAGELTARPARATDDPAAVGPVDVVLFCVKLYDLQAAGEAIRPLVGDGTMVVTLQNGVEAPDLLDAILGAGHVVPGVTYVSGTRTAPGVIRYAVGDGPAMILGERGGAVSPRVARFETACARAGLGVRVSPDIERILWSKFVLFACNAGLTCLARQPVGVVYGQPHLRGLASDCMQEVAAVGRAKGIFLAPDIVDSIFRQFDSWLPDVKASMLVDLEHGRPLEVEWVAGTVCRLGEALGVPTPINRIIHAVLKPHARGHG